MDQQTFKVGELGFNDVVDILSNAVLAEMDIRKTFGTGEKLNVAEVLTGSVSTILANYPRVAAAIPQLDDFKNQVLDLVVPEAVEALRQIGERVGEEAVEQSALYDFYVLSVRSYVNTMKVKAIVEEEITLAKNIFRKNDIEPLSLV